MQQGVKTSVRRNMKPVPFVHVHHPRQNVVSSSSAVSFRFFALFNQLDPAPWVVLHHLVLDLLVRAHCLVLCHTHRPLAVHALGLPDKLWYL